MQNFETMRTGKTGVAFGLIRSIDSARDVFVIPYEVDEEGEVPFPYLLGIKSRKETFECLIGEKYHISLGLLSWRVHVMS